MNRKDLFGEYTAILKEELIPAMGCTEPIAIAYAAAKCRQLLGERPESCCMEVSGSIIKNVQSVIVPNTGGRKGLHVALAAGMAVGNPDVELQVLAGVTPEMLPEIDRFLDEVPMNIQPSQNGIMFYIDVTGKSGAHTARVCISNFHTNITHLELDGKVLLTQQKHEDGSSNTDHDLLRVEQIWDYTNTVEIGEIEDVIARQIAFNSAISKAGMENDWGAQIGKILDLESNGDIRMRARAMAAAGSDARMSGCELPAIILSGSGNQGITATMPVLVFSESLKSTKEQLYRALILADLITIHLKTGIGSISAFCGATFAGIGAGCGIAYLRGGDYQAICHTIVNALAILSGMICDGAKPSCAAKIAMAVDAGILGFDMYNNGQQFYGGDGVIKKGVENSIRSVCKVAREGMRETNERILEVMLEND